MYVMLCYLLLRYVCLAGLTDIHFVFLLLSLIVAMSQINSGLLGDSYGHPKINSYFELFIVTLKMSLCYHCENEIRFL